MTILRQIADFLAFRARAAALAQKLEDGVLSSAERDAALSALLLAPVAKPVRSAKRMAAKTATA